MTELRRLTLAFAHLGTLLILCLFAVSAAAQDTSGRHPADGWSFQITPYFWVAGIDGDLRAGSRLPKVKVDASFSDIAENLEFGLMLWGEARRDRFSILGELDYLSLSTNGDTQGPLFGNVKANSKTLFATLFGTYEVLSGQAWALDTLAGGRVWHLRTELKVKSGLIQGREVDESEDWVDPLVGGRLRIALGHGFSLVGEADIGGFGVGSDSTWEVLGVAGYRFNDWLSAYAGYRYLKVDYDQNNFLYDVAISGPLTGVMIRF